MKDETLDRREFFKRAATVGAAVTGAGTLLAACEKGGGGDRTAEGGGDKTGGKAGGEKAGDDKAGGGTFSCDDTSGLKESQIKVRKSLKYVDKSEKEGQYCDNCQYWQPEKKDGQCGGCQVVPGPIHPKGWCTSWVETKA